MVQDMRHHMYLFGTYMFLQSLESSEKPQAHAQTGYKITNANSIALIESYSYTILLAITVICQS